MSENTDIKKLYGVGSVRAAQYKKMGITSVEDLLCHYPRGYEDRGSIKLLCEADGEGKSAFLLTVATQPKSVRIRGRMSLTKFRAYDDSALCEITFFNQEYLKSTFVPGTTFRFYGKVEKKKGVYSMTSPAYEPWVEGKPLPELIPVYPLDGFRVIDVFSKKRSKIYWFLRTKGIYVLYAFFALSFIADIFNFPALDLLGNAIGFIKNIT